MYEILEDLWNGGQENIQEIENPCTENLNNEVSESGFYIQNGILYNGNIDSMMADLYQDMSENLEEQNRRREELGASGEMYIDGAGIIHNAPWEDLYDSLMKEVPAQIEAMAKVNQENLEKGIFPPLYDGFASNPYYDPTGSWGASMAAWDTLNDLNTPSAPDYTLDYTAEELESEISHSLNMAGQYRNAGMDTIAGGFENRADSAVEKMKDLI